MQNLTCETTILIYSKHFMNLIAKYFKDIMKDCSYLLGSSIFTLVCNNFMQNKNNYIVMV